MTEATHSSVLWVRQGRLEGTPEGHEILPGMTRQLVLRLARSLEIRFSGSHVKLAELAGAEEIILVGTTIEVLPVVRIDDKTIGTGRPGPVRGGSGMLIARKSNTGWLASRRTFRSFRPPSPGAAHDHERGQRRPL